MDNKQSELLERFLALLSDVDVSGFSINVQGETPTCGYMVALAGFERIVDASAGTWFNILRYAQDYASELVKPGVYLGGWTSNGRLYLDVSECIVDVRKAKIAGLKRSQLAIWDVAHSCEIAL